MRQAFIICFLVLTGLLKAQLPVARDTISVIENGKVLRLPWAGGLNYTNVSEADLNGDGLKDLVLFDKINLFGTGRFRCFIRTGAPGQTIFRHDAQLSYNFPQAANWAVMHDFNCDGKADLFCSTISGIRVYRNTSSGGNLSFAIEKNLLYTNYGGQNGTANLYASGSGVPGIADVDKDGDLDILTFSPQGVFIEFHKNMSKELGYGCDSLRFQAADLCWGKISESQCTVSLNQCLPKSLFIQDGTGRKEYHAGSCLTCLDSDGDQDQDLLLGDISCNTVQYAHNTGSSSNALFTDTTVLYPGYPAKGSSTQIRLNNFPCAYFLDADGDGVKDLIATPNAAGSENYKSVWLYKNVSSTGTVNFQYVKNNFLQDEMIESGLCAFPVTIDYDTDGKKDLLIGNFGYYINGGLKAQLTLYKNTGTSSVPVYSLITRDYGNLSAQNLNNVLPTVGDIDGDGDEDILVGTGTGQVHWLKNTAGAGNPCNFSSFLSNPFTFTTSSAVAAPQLFDLDGDQLLDLLIGGKNGRIAFYKNTGTSSVPSFSLVTALLGQVDVKGDVNFFGLDGYAVPFFYRENNSVRLLVGSVSGGVWQYAVQQDVSLPFIKLSQAVNGLYEGAQSAVLYEDLNNDGKRDLLLGNGGGGLSYFSSSSPFVSVADISKSEDILVIMPNPASSEFTVSVQEEAVINKLMLRDVSGRLVKSSEVSGAAAVIDVTDLPAGIYFCVVSVITSDGGAQQLTRKLIKSEP